MRAPFPRPRAWPVPFDPDTELDWSEPAISRRLLREHLDPGHDSASRRPVAIARHLRRLDRLIPPGSQVLDAACGPGLYAIPLALAGHSVHGVDVSPPAIRHARAAARDAGVTGVCRFTRGDLRGAPLGDRVDAAVLIYNVLESFSRADQVAVLRRLATALRHGGRVIVEMRTRVDHPPGRLSHWDVVADSLLADRPHVLLTDTVYDPRRHTYVLRLGAVTGEGLVMRQTSAALTPVEAIPGLFARAGLAVRRIHDGWSSRDADASSESVLVIAERR